MSEDDDLGPITDEEREAAEALRKELDRGGDPAPGSDAAFAAAVRASMLGAKTPLEGPARAEAVKAAITEGSRRARRRSIRTMFAIAAAALLAVAVPTAMYAGTASEGPALTYGGPTDAVFDGPFEDTQRASERMDRIVDARTHDYFAALRGEQP